MQCNDEGEKMMRMERERECGGGRKRVSTLYTTTSESYYNGQQVSLLTTPYINTMRQYRNYYYRDILIAVNSSVALLIPSWSP